MRTFAVLLACLWHPGIARAGDTNCVDLSQFDEASLRAYAFDAEADRETVGALQRDHDYVTGEVRVVVQPIFDTSDPAEDRALFRWANRLHVQTRHGTIRESILFRPGAPGYQISR